MDYSKAKTYSKIMWIVYIIIAICAITFISKQEAKLKTPVIEDVGESSTVTDSTVTNDEKKENLVEIYMPNNNGDEENSDENNDTTKDTQVIPNDKQK